MADFDDADWEKRATRFQDSNASFWEKPFHSRQKFTLARIPRQLDLHASIHSAKCEVYINGKRVETLEEKGKNANGSDKLHKTTLSQEVLDTLRVGDNVLAIRYEKQGKSPRASVAMMQVFARPK